MSKSKPRVFPSEERVTPLFAFQDPYVMLDVMADSQETPDEESKNISVYLPIVGSAIVLGLAFDYFFFKHLPGLSFPFYVILILLAFFLLAKKFQIEINISIIFLSVPLLFFSAMVPIRSSGLLTFLNLSISFYLLVLIADAALGLKIRTYFIIDYIKPLFLLPLNTLDKFFRAIGDLASSRPKVNEQVTGQVLRGVLLSIPILFLFLLLLSSADIVFEQYVSKIVDIYISPDTITRIILVSIVTTIFIGAFTYIFLKPGNQFKIGQGKSSSRRLGLIEGSILLGLVDLLFLSFILVQITYLFGGKRTIAIKGVTYAQYARSGFFQLLAVAVISFLLIWLTEKYIFRDDSGHALSFKLLGGLLVLEVMIIMASAFKRLLLYEGAYGFTILRFYSHMFTIWLVVIFALLLYKILANTKENALALSAFVSTLIFLGALNIINPEAFIARQNIERFHKTGKLDVFYLGKLSDDAGDELIEVLGLEGKKSNFNKSMFIAGLYKRRQDLKRIAKEGGWQSLNLARTRTLRSLDDRAPTLKRYKDHAN